MGTQNQMKRNGTEFIEPGLGGHPRYDRNCGTVAFDLACDKFFQKRGMAKGAFIPIQQPKKRKK
jgi:hypothetical protein